jgi:pimeloyl-ACP methyl ester carboxylesterase
MSTFVLVHGSFHGAWCWEKVVPLLEKGGHRAIALDLPGHGEDRTPLPQLTLERYADKVCAAIAAERDPVVLVGHSMGGMVITATAERVPERLVRLVYLCAFLPASGQSLLDLAKTDRESALMPDVVIDEPGGAHWVREGAARAAFYGDCPDDDAARAQGRLCKEPLAVVATPVITSAARFGRVPRVYIECSADRAIGPALQKRMVAAQPCRLLSLPSGHSPFYAMPDALARQLVEAA